MIRSPSKNPPGGFASLARRLPGNLLLVAIACFNIATTHPAGAEEGAIVARTYLPSALNVQGEFRLLQRGSEWVAQTVLNTSSLRRAVQRIAQKERSRFATESGPQLGEGSLPEDSANYLQDLESAKRAVLEQPELEEEDWATVDPVGDPADAADSRLRKRLLIEFTCGPGQGANRVEIFRVRLGRTAEGFEVLQRALLSSRPVAPKYAANAVLVQVHEAHIDPPPEAMQGVRRACRLP